MAQCSGDVSVTDAPVGRRENLTDVTSGYHGDKSSMPTEATPGGSKSQSFPCSVATGTRGAKGVN